MAGKASGITDFGKLFAKIMKSKSQQKVRYNFSKQAGNLNRRKGASSPYPRQSKTGRISKTPVERPKAAKSRQGATLPKTEADKKAAEKGANYYLRRGGKSKDSKPSGNDKAVDVQGSIISPPPKATMRPPKPSSKSYEADPTRRLEGTPSKKKQQKPRKGNQAKGTKPNQGTKKSKGGYTQSSSVKPKGNTSAGSAEGKATQARDRAGQESRAKTRNISEAIRGNVTANNAARLRELRANVANAKTPQERNRATKALNGFIYQLNKRK